MNRQDVEKTITEYLKPIFGFALKRCKSIHDAEDLSQEITIRAFRALLIKDDVADMGKFIWTVAHNTLSNYYRDTAKSMIGVSIDEIAELIADPDSELEIDDNTETIRRLQSEIAYLSKLQRRIVIAYYFENRKQADIATELGVPLGTVKWHLFEAKKELKRGMDTMRKASELKFNPIKFHSYGINGSIGTKSPDEFFRSTLSQNICYCVRNTAKTINEIADDLGVSPVYVETEVEFLEEYGFLQVQKDKYIVNFIISEPTAELLTMQNDMYKRAAELFANDLYDELTSSGILDDPDILCGQTDAPISFTESPKADRNFVLWSLIPYIAAWSGEKLIFALIYLTGLDYFITQDLGCKYYGRYMDDFYADVLGKPCKITSLMEGYSAMLMLGQEEGMEHMNYLHTSTVYSFEEQEDGCVIINTRNSIYTLEPIGGDAK